MFRRWRSLHDDEVRTLKVFGDPLGDDPRHRLVGVVESLPATKAQRLGERARKVAAVGGRKAFIRHSRTIARL